MSGGVVYPMVYPHDFLADCLTIDVITLGPNLKVVQRHWRPEARATELLLSGSGYNKPKNVQK